MTYLIDEVDELRQQVRLIPASICFTDSPKITRHRVQLALAASDARAILIDEYEAKMRDLEDEADRRVREAVCPTFSSRSMGLTAIF